MKKIKFRCFTFLFRGPIISNIFLKFDVLLFLNSRNPRFPHHHCRQHHGLNSWSVRGYKD
jgi:hypothetical protein